MLPSQINIGPINFHVYGLMIALSILTAWYVAKKRAHIYKIPQEIFGSLLLLIPLILGIFGARIYHVIDFWSVYGKDPVRIFRIDQGGMGIWGALAGIFLGFYLVARIKKINQLSLLDLIAPSLLLAQAIGRLGNYFNQEGFGPPTSAPWGIYIAPQNRPENLMDFSRFHPTFFYEMLLDLIFFLILMKISLKLKKPGMVFGYYLVLYAIGRFIVEFYRIDTAIFMGIKIAQVLALIGFTSGLFLILKPKILKNRD